MIVIKCGSGYLKENGNLLWSQQRGEINFVLIVLDDLSNGIPECNSGIQNHSEVTGGQGEAAT